MRNNSVIGIDIGGTKIRSIVWDGVRVRNAVEYKTPKTEKEFIKILMAYAGDKPVGVGTAGRVKKLKVVSSRNIPYLKNFSFKKIFKNKLVGVTNDAEAFGRAEYACGAARGARSALFFTIGTGIGRAYGRNGVVLHQKIFTEHAEKWEKEYQYVRDSNKNLPEYLAVRLSVIIRKYGPDVIVFGGGVIERKGFFARLKKGFLAHDVRVAIRRSKLGRNAAAVGAVLR